MRTDPLVGTGLAALLTATLGTVTTAAPAWAAPPPAMTLSTAQGPSGGGNTVTGSVGGNVLAFPAGTNPVVQFQFNAPTATSCSTNAEYDEAINGTSSALTAGVLTVNPSQVRRISNTKLAFTVPAGLTLLPGQLTSKWNVCVYNNDSPSASTLIATSSYTIALRPTITAILPARSPAGGGQTITVNGAGFGPGTTATIDGAALTDINLANTGDSFTATTPAHRPGTGYPLVVKTSGGLVSSADPDNNGQPEDNDSSTPDSPILFTFENSITVSPNTAPAESSPYLDIRGSGFDNLTFDPDISALPTASTAHVFLVRDAYDSATNRGVQECGEVIVLDDTELICRLDLSADSLDPADSTPRNGVPVAEGTYTVTVVANGADGTANPGATLVTSGATFTVAPY